MAAAAQAAPDLFECKAKMRGVLEADALFASEIGQISRVLASEVMIA
ncbi:MAG: hypothetical protein Q9M13_07095 [Mariprofundales bacterium]|nr:hypothetical protein [Mariprofundales bacterium]